MEGFLEAAGLDEEPLGMFYAESFSSPMREAFGSGAL